MRLSQIRRHIGGVSLAYGVAVGLLYLGELSLSVTQSRSEFGAYQYVRQLLPILVLIALAGLDQAVPREFAAARIPRWITTYSVLGGLLVRALIIVIPVAMVLSVANILPSSYIIALVIAVGTIIISEYCSAVLRARNALTVAAFVQQAYRVVLGVGLMIVGILGVGNPPVFFALSGLFGAAVAVAMLKPSGVSGRLVVRPELQKLRRIGWPIAASGLALGLGDYADVAMLTQVTGSLDATGHYSAWKLYVCYPWIALSSIIGFALLPVIVRMLAAGRQAEIRRMSRLLVRAVLPTLLVLSCACVIVVDRMVLDVPSIAYFLVVSGVVRLIYVFPSALLGASASPRTLRMYAVWCYVSVVLEASIIAFGSQLVSPENAAALGLLVAVVLRWMMAEHMVGKVLSQAGA